MKRYLFSNFLEEKIVYHTCQDYWQIKLGELFFENKIMNAKPYLNTKFGDGTDFYNGNPIVNYYFAKTAKAIRIIQEKPNKQDIEITAWLDTFETEDIAANELVISLQLTPKSEEIAFDIIEKWIIDDYSLEIMKRYIKLKLELSQLEKPDYETEKISLK